MSSRYSDRRDGDDDKAVEAQIFICQNFACHAPVESVHQAWEIIEKSKNN